jgi:hypothetical protein
MAGFNKLYLAGRLHRAGWGQAMPFCRGFRRVRRALRQPSRVAPACLALWPTLSLLLLAAALPARAAIQFDPFPGYDGLVPQASWFPVVFEIKNDGPSFNGVVEITGGGLNQEQTRRLQVELPTGTLKRVVVPMFAGSRAMNTSWEARLLDERGRVRAEQTGLRPRKVLGPGTPLLGAIPRTPNGTPVIRPILSQDKDLQPFTARLLPTIFPDNPLTLEGMSSLYVNSEKASELGVNQVNALLGWLNAGGHLIVGVEQPSDVTSSPWLKSLVPCELRDSQTVPVHGALDAWVRSAAWPANARALGQVREHQVQPNRTEARPGVDPDRPLADLASDPAFDSASLQVAVGQVREGRVVVSAGSIPLVVSAVRGRGEVTVLLFSPEREPARSWRNLPAFWARLAEVPGAWYVYSDFNSYGSWSSDGIFGGMLDSRQVHRLPIWWLLLLLVVYLVVIGPFDQYWLKRIGRPMLTWVTFPCYVVGFSLVIYVIGYKLRAGESEWNELHVVDVFENGTRAELRGRTYSSVYSPSNQRYKMESQQKYATLRGEFASAFNGGQASEKASVLQVGDSFKAEIFVPVWTSQLFVSDWWQPAPMPVSVGIKRQDDKCLVRVQNHTERLLTHVQVVIDGRIQALGDVAANETKSFPVNPQKGRLLLEYVSPHAPNFQSAVQSRRQAFGTSTWIDDLPDATTAVSFMSQCHRQDYYNNFVLPPGLDLTPVTEHGGAVLLAWAEDYAPIKAMYQFSPRRSQRHTLWRVATAVQ